MEGHTIAGTLKLLEVKTEDRAEEILSAFRRYVEDPQEVEGCVVDVEDILAYYPDGNGG